MKVLRSLFYLAVLSFVGLILLCGGIGFMANMAKHRQPEARSQRSTPAAKPVVQQSQPKPTIDKTPEIQKKREELLQKLMSEGVFHDIQTGKATVGTKFYLLDFAQKQSFVSVVYAWSFDGSNQYDMVLLYDVRTNKRVGSFSRITGLVLD